MKCEDIKKIQEEKRKRFGLETEGTTSRSIYAEE